MTPINPTQIDLYNTLIGFKKINGNDALAALLRKIGVKNPSEIDAARFPEIEMLCKAGTRGLNVVEGEDEATGASDALDKIVDARTRSDVEVVLRSGGKSIAQGMDNLGRVLNARSK
jgi:hypothetical protein